MKIDIGGTAVRNFGDRIGDRIGWIFGSIQYFWQNATCIAFAGSALIKGKTFDIEDQKYVLLFSADFQKDKRRKRQSKSRCCARSFPGGENASAG